MKLIVLCGGKGSRLRSLTRTKPKALVRYKGHCIIDEVLKFHTGHELVFSAGYKGDKISEYVCLNYPGSHVYIEDEELGTGGAVKEVASLFTDEYFGVINGDTVFDLNIENVLNDLKTKPDCILNAVMATDIVSGANSYAGMYVFHRSFLDYIRAIPSKLEDCIAEAVTDRKVYFTTLKNPFFDLGTFTGMVRYDSSFSYSA